MNFIWISSIKLFEIELDCPNRNLIELNGNIAQKAILICYFSYFFFDRVNKEYI